MHDPPPETPGRASNKDTSDRIFDPYFSTKDVGTGLGLPIAHKIIEEHGGAIRVTSGPGQGTTVVIDLPGRRMIGVFARFLRK